MNLLYLHAHDAGRYMAAVEVMDACCGVVLDALRASKHDGDTLVIFTLDHGIAFPGLKCQLTDAGMGVSLIVNYPGNPTAGTACDALVSQLDGYPTVCDMLDLPRPDWLQGKSLRPSLEDTSRKLREEVFSEVTYHATYEPARCIRTERHKLIRLFDEDTMPPPSNVDDSPSKDVMGSAGYFTKPRDAIQLYELLLDPNEAHNLAGSPDHARILRDLDQRLTD